jgi:hypothetical protein
MGRTKAIPGVSFRKETIGGRWLYWRASVGKKLTGDKAIQRRFSTYGEAVQWVNGLIEEREKHGTEVFSLTHSSWSCFQGQSSKPEVISELFWGEAPWYRRANKNQAI